MNSNRLPIALFIVGLGMIFYQLVFHPHGTQSNLGFKFFVAKGDLAEDQNDVDLSMHPHKKKTPMNQVGGLQPVIPAQIPEPQVPETAATPAPGAAANGMSVEDLAKLADAKLEAEKAKKKKKKKKKVVSPLPDQIVQAQAPAEAPPEKSNNSEPFAPAPVAPYNQNPNAAVNGNQPGTPNANSDILPPTANSTASLISNWQELLLKTPNTQETQMFITEHKSMVLNDEVFFTVTAAMAKDTRPQMQDLAAMCYASYPNIKSFEGLVGLIDASTAGSQVHTDATNDIAAYGSPFNTTDMGILAVAMTAPPTSPSLHLEAVQTVDAAVKQFSLVLTGQGTTSQTGATTTPPGKVTASSVSAAEKSFQAFVGPLTQLAKTSTTASLRGAATQSLTDIQSVITPQQNLTGIQ